MENNCLGQETKKKGRFDGFLLCSDLDRTFVNSSGLIEKNLEALRYYINEGGLFTLATGRSWFYIDDIYKQAIPINTHLICFNGAVIYDRVQKKNLYERKVSRPLLERILREKSNLFKGAEGYFHTDMKTCSSYEETGNAPIRKAVFSFARIKDCLSAKDELEASYGHLVDLNRSWPEGLELLDKNSEKGQAVRAMRALLGSSVHTVVCVGDYENDISMLREADIGYAVANALPSVAEAADRQTVSCGEGAIEGIIKDLSNH